jgi:hypothetical protein
LIFQQVLRGICVPRFQRGFKFKKQSLKKIFLFKDFQNLLKKKQKQNNKPKQMAQVSMQNLPLEIIAEISGHLKLKDFAHFSSTCKEYRDLFSKDIEEYKNIDEIVKGTCYYKVSIAMSPEVTYDYYVYVVDEGIDFYKQKYNKHKLLDKFINSIEPVTVILKPKVYSSESGEYVETGESRKKSFDSLLYYVCKSFIAVVWKSRRLGHFFI